MAAKETGEPVAEVTVKVRLKSHERMLAWARGLDQDREFALEDCRHVSGNLERFLIVRGEKVVRVPPNQQRLRRHLHDLDPSFEVPIRALDRFCWLDRIEERLTTEPASTTVRIALELDEDCRRITTRVNQLEAEISALVNEHFPEMMAMPGCGALTAAKLVGEIAGIERFSSDAKLAMYAGVGPLEASSGNRQRHLNRGGNRQLNTALHRIAVTAKDAAPDLRPVAA